MPAVVSFPDYPPSILEKSLEENTNEIMYGDGYEQSFKNEINHLRRMFTLAFNHRPNIEAQAIEDFLLPLSSVTPFWFTPPNEVTPIQVKRVKNSFKRIPEPPAGRTETIQAVFKESFDL